MTLTRSIIVFLLVVVGTFMIDYNIKVLAMEAVGE